MDQRSVLEFCGVGWKNVSFVVSAGTLCYSELAER